MYPGIDPVTGFPIDPVTGIPYDPTTGLPVPSTPTTGGDGVDWTDIIKGAEGVIATIFGHPIGAGGRPITPTPGGGGVSVGGSISTNTLLLIVGGMMIFMLSRRR